MEKCSYCWYTYLIALEKDIFITEKEDKMTWNKGLEKIEKVWLNALWILLNSLITENRIKIAGKKCCTKLGLLLEICSDT